MTEFDYVIVGAGSSGCVLANRLSEDPGNKVLLIEAGGENQNRFIKMPAGFMKLYGDPRYYWRFPVRPQLGRGEERWNYGKGLGGSSAVNGTWYLRGMPRDYDGWRDMGLTEWSWATMEPCFRWMESYRESGAHPSRGTDGPLQITQATYRSAVTDAIVAAAASVDLPFLDDINAPNTDGIGRSQYTVDRRGTRASSYEAFVAPIRRRPNLTIATETTVSRVRVEGGRATAVLCESRGRQIAYSARREVILSAGVYQSPKILQLSGIGPRKLLEQHGIEIVQSLPAVGRNISDHQMVTLSYRLLNDPGLNREYSGWRLYTHALRYFLGGQGLLARAGVPLTLLWSSEGERDWPDMQIGIGPFAMKSSREMKVEPGRGPIASEPGIMFAGFHRRPRSRGSVSIASADPHEMPVVEAGWWDDPFDREKAIELLRMLRKLASSEPMRRFVGEEKVPGAQFQADDELIEELKWVLSPGLHGTGSCAMGLIRESSVVDGRCRVHGIDGLRIVDCSIMPTTVSGNTNGPAMAIAARAAELILDDVDPHLRYQNGLCHLDNGARETGLD